MNHFAMMTLLLNQLKSTFSEPTTIHQLNLCDQLHALVQKYALNKLQDCISMQLTHSADAPLDPPTLILLRRTVCLHPCYTSRLCCYLFDIKVPNSVPAMVIECNYSATACSCLTVYCLHNIQTCTCRQLQVRVVFGGKRHPAVAQPEYGWKGLKPYQFALNQVHALL